MLDRYADEARRRVLRATDSAVKSPQVRNLKRHCRPALCKNACDYGLHPRRNLISRARNRDTTPPPRNPAISLAQNFHHPRNSRRPKKGPPPPPPPRDTPARPPPAVPAPVAQKKLHLPHQFFPPQTK